MISDYSAFQRHNRELGIDLLDGGKESFVFSLNIPTGIYFEVVANCCALGEVTDEMAQAELILESAALLMGTVGLTIEWVQENISLENQADLINIVLGAINQEFGKEIYEIPNFKIKKKKSKSGKDEQSKKKETIASLQKLLDKYGEKEESIMQDFQIVMANTPNTFKDILDMPIFAYRLLLNRVCIENLQQDDDWKIKYLEYKIEKCKDKIMQRVKPKKK